MTNSARTTEGEGFSTTKSDCMFMTKTSTGLVLVLLTRKKDLTVSRQNLARPSRRSSLLPARPQWVPVAG